MFDLLFDLNSLFEFSRANCIAICSFLVPANMLVTLLTMALVGMRRPKFQVLQSVAIACFLALVMIGHVMTWFAIGVVMAPTYILLCLASVCIILNVWAIAFSESFIRFWWLHLFFPNVSPKVSEHH